MRRLTWTLMLLLLPGVVCSQWKVTYGQEQICAFKGSSVVIPCSFEYPSNMQVQRVMWGHERAHIYDGPFIYDSESNNSLRYKYVGDKRHNCSLQIQEVEQKDSGKHAFRFIAGSADGKADRWTGSAGSRLEVSDLKIRMLTTNGNDSLKEGDSVQLTCSSQCSSGGPHSFTWLKDGQPIREGPVLQLSNISHTDSGNYSCSPNAQRRPTSEVVNIDAEYGPKNTTASVRPSTEVDVGSSITLVCSSTANPAVGNYTWLKRGDEDVTVGNGPELNVVDIQAHDGGQYLCRAANKHGHQTSSVVTIKVKAYWPTFTRDALIIAAVAALILTILVTMRRRFKRKIKAQQIIQETEHGEDTQDTVYSNLPVFANIQSETENQYQEITTGTVYAAVDFNAKRKSNTQQQTDDEENQDAGVIYSTVCREVMLKPSDMEQL